MRENRPTGDARSRRALVGFALLAALVAAGIAGLVWRLTGGRWLVVRSASMGRTAPVGSLVFTRPTTADQVRVGDIVSYRVPSHPDEVVTHRVVSAVGGVLQTKGDINVSPDPWNLHSADLLGHVVSIWWGLGWLLRAVPILLLGGLLVWAITRFLVTPRWRGPLRLFGASIVVAVAAVVLRPFVGMTLLMTGSDVGVARVVLVSTGLLPIRVSAPDGSFVDLVDGEVGTLTTHVGASPHAVPLTSHPHLSWWGWVLLVLIWLIPVFWAFAAGPGPQPRDGAAHGDDPRDPDDPAGTGTTPEGASDGGSYPPSSDPGLLTHARLTRTRQAGALLTRAVRRRPRRVAEGLTAALLASLLVTAGTSTAAAFTAVVKNSTDTAATGVFNTCASALSAIGQSSTIFTYPLGDASLVTGSTAADVSGNARPGTYSGLFNSSTSHPCPRDTQTTAATLVPTAATPSYVYSSYKTTATNVFSEVVWFNTPATNTTGGRMIGWSTAQTGTSSVYDRHVYMTNGGLVIFGVYPNGVKTISSTAAYNDGKWHQVVATLSTAGMFLYVDGAQVAKDTTTFYGENSGGTVGGTPVETGWWRVGYDNLSGWTSQPTTNYWSGTMAWASVFTVALSATQVATLYAAGT